MAILLDTSVVIHLLRRQPSAEAYFIQLPDRASISVITLAEVGAGVRGRREEDDANLFWSLVHVLPVDTEIAVRAGQFVRHFGRSHGVEIPDALIAATAEQHGLRLATLNVKHFPMLPKLKPPY